ncbi:DUF924 family protein [Octadecabacter arcticus]|uniref:DUF924 family protein n=1 Tax=Octadecabacter arcticus TaxID=53946 RepID=UPI0009FFBD96|nr:DUF924 family protein [Octadecabacter arcticus]
MGIIATFARHPHRNAVLGRASTAAEEAYIATGDFVRSYCQIWCLSIVCHAVIWSGFVVSIPSLNVTPVMTFAR